MRAALAGERYDIAVIGGGINGVAIARECARAGRRTLLVEAHDFAAGTTSRSTRIIHGGLRYLEHKEFGLVRESLRERERLRRQYPHLVRPLRFVLALAPGGRHNAFTIRTGLWLYKRLGGSFDDSGTTRGDTGRLLESRQDWALFDYDDAQCAFPERLVAEWVGEAMAAGATVRNHCRALEIIKLDGRVTGLIVRDELTGEESRIDCKYIVNATGPWADRLCAEAGIETKQRMVGGIRGSHIVLPRFDGAPGSALYTEAPDGRPFFVIPWNSQVLVGTTEIPDDADPARTQPAPEEITYLLEAANRLYPHAELRASDILYAFAGVRPLPFSPKTEPAAVTRHHHLHYHRDEGTAGMLSVIGGKLTTAAALAREVASALGCDVSQPQIAMVAPAPNDGICATFAQWARQVSQVAGISEFSARAIAEWHGRRAMCVARLAAADDFLRQPLCPHSDHIVAEAVESVRFECAANLGDILLRRVPVALNGCWSEECTRAAARNIGRAMGWDDHRTGYEAERFEEERAAFLVKPGGVTLPQRAA